MFRATLFGLALTVGVAAPQTIAPPLKTPEKLLVVPTPNKSFKEWADEGDRIFRDQNPKLRLTYKDKEHVIMAKVRLLHPAEYDTVPRPGKNTTEIGKFSPEELKKIDKDWQNIKRNYAIFLLQDPVMAGPLPPSRTTYYGFLPLDSDLAKKSFVPFNREFLAVITVKRECPEGLIAHWGCHVLLTCVICDEEAK